MEERPTVDPPIANPTPEDVLKVEDQKNDNDRCNENPNLDLTSGFTFLGQFVDHDITFDTTDAQQATVRPRRHHQLPHTSLRPRRDLRAGPQLQPAVLRPQRPGQVLDLVETTYSDITGILKIGNDFVDGTWPVKADTVYDVPREYATGKATIADPRNDQTLIILQLHIAFQMFHNKLVDLMRKIRISRVRRCSSRPGAWPGGTTSGS